jgi:hypothetical protein
MRHLAILRREERRIEAQSRLPGEPL